MSEPRSQQRDTASRGLKDRGRPKHSAYDKKLIRIQRDLGTALGSTSDLGTALEFVLDATCGLEIVECAAIHMANAQTGGYELAAHRGLTPRCVEILRLHTPEFVMLSRDGMDAPIQPAPPAMAPESDGAPEPPQALAVIPIQHDGRIIATLSAGSHSDDHFPATTRVALEAIAVQVSGILARIRAEMALRESEERYRSLFNDISEAVMVLDLDADWYPGRFLQVNDAACHQLGYTRDELLGLSPRHISTLDESDLLGSIRTSLLETREARFETEHITKHGARVPVEIHLRVIELDGRAAATASSRDISVRKRAEEAVRLEQHRISASLRLAQRPICSRHELLGAALDEAVALSGSEFGYLHYCQEESDTPCATAQGGSTDPELFSMVGLADPEFWRETLERRCPVIINSAAETVAGGSESGPRRRMSVPVFDSDHVVAVAGLAGKLCNYTDLDARQVSQLMEAAWKQATRHEAERALAESEQRFRMLCANARDAIALSDADGRITFFNSAAEAIFGYSEREAVGRELTSLFGVGHAVETVSRTLQRLRNAASETAGHVLELDAMRRDGASFPMELSLSVLRIQDGWNTIAIARDISSRRQVEEERRQLQVDLAHAQKMEAVGQLAGGVAHDFNNLLQVISGNLDLLFTDVIPPHPVYEGMVQIQRATDRATSLVRQLLLFSRKSDLKLEIVDVNRMIEGLLKMLRRVIGEHIDLHFDASPEPIRAFADPGQLEQALMNLCINARDAMPKGGRLMIATRQVQPATAAKRDAVPIDNQAHVLITVNDTGEGIPFDVQDRIFEPFFSTKKAGQGTGLGLATVFAIVERHQGSVSFTSKPGEGTEFALEIPLNLPRTETQAGPAESASRIVETSGKTVLLAEDDEPIRTLTETILKRTGYRVITAEDGELAMELFEKHADEIDIAVLDIIMPRKTGRSVLDLIRRRQPELPVILISGYSAETLDLEAMQDRHTELLQKPFPTRELLQRMAARLT